ncbi:MAG: hypothetical protein AVDCRST_MAG15-3104, partial [uncultured Rubellimicrobium sp.]
DNHRTRLRPAHRSPRRGPDAPPGGDRRAGHWLPRPPEPPYRRTRGRSRHRGRRGGGGGPRAPGRGHCRRCHPPVRHDRFARRRWRLGPPPAARLGLAAPPADSGHPRPSRRATWGPLRPKGPAPHGRLPASRRAQRQSPAAPASARRRSIRHVGLGRRARTLPPFQRTRPGGRARASPHAHARPASGRAHSGNRRRRGARPRSDQAQL